MKQDQVVVGKRYVAKISGNLTVVEIKQPIDRGTRQRRRLHWRAVNLKTKREVEIKSASALRREANDADIRAYAPNTLTKTEQALVSGLVLGSLSRTHNVGREYGG